MRARRCGPLRRPWLIALAMAVAAPAGAQVVLDGSLGRAGALAGPNYAITPDLGRQLGGNLFHSFSRFDVATGQSATFSGPSSVANIIARVTGGNASSIDGALRSTIPGADLFLFNPSGIAFGPNATIDVGGAFHVSTAQQLRLADGARIDAANPAASTFTSAPPEAFGFLGGQGAITFSGSDIRTLTGSPITVSAESIDVGRDSLLYSRGAAMGLAAVPGVGEVAIGRQGIGAVTGATGDILVRGGVASDTGAGRLPAGTVRIIGGRIGIEEAGGVTAINGADGAGGAIAVDASEWIVILGTLNGDTYGRGASGGISLAAPAILIAGEGTVSASSLAAGSAGPISVQARDLKIDEDGRIMSIAFAQGDAGSIHVTADNSITLDSRGAISASSQASGAGGDITVRTDVLTISLLGHIASTAFDVGRGGSVAIDVGELNLDGGFISANSSVIGYGDAGNLTVHASRGIVIDGSLAGLSASTSEGRGGNILVVTPSLEMRNGGHIHTFTAGSGHAGDVDLRVGDLAMNDWSTISASSGSEASGDGGNITIAATHGVLIDGNVLGGIDANALGSGNGGSIAITTPTLDVRGASISVSTHGSGRGGSIAIDTGRLSLSEEGSIDLFTIGSGHGGSLSVRAREVSLSTRGRIYAFVAGTGDGGDVSIHATDSVRLVGSPEESEEVVTGTGIYAFVTGAGHGADVTISAPQVVIDNYAQVSAHTGGTGSGGSVTVQADDVAITRQGVIDASSTGAGAGGNIILDATRSILLADNDGRLASGLFARAYDAGAGGTIRVSAPEVTVDAALVSAATGGTGRGGSIAIAADRLSLLHGGQLNAASVGAGAAGDIAVSARVEVSASGSGAPGPSGIVTETLDTGAGGTMTITSPRVGLTDGAMLSARSGGTGTGGGIHVTASDDLYIGSGAAISTQTVQSDGGNIHIDATGLVHLENGAITTSVAGGAGNGGNITLASPQHVVLDASAIRANAYGGNGGNIRIDSSYFVGDSLSVVEASSALGVSGVVDVSAPIVDIGSGLGVLPPPRFDATRLLREACASRAGSGSSFVVVGRGGLPESPWSALSSPVAELLAAPRAAGSVAAAQRGRDPCVALR